MAGLINGFLNRKLRASDRLVSFISFLLLSVSQNLSLITQTDDQVPDGCRWISFNTCLKQITNMKVMLPLIRKT